MQLQVVKIGGSLVTSELLPLWLNWIQGKSHIPTVIVPGGGPFANQVRAAQQHWQFDNVAAHHMALLGMQQMGYLFEGLNSKLSLAQSKQEILYSLRYHNAVVWKADLNWLTDAGLEAGWHITSDSIAAWLAGQLGAANLYVVKSITVPHTADLSELAKQGIVDAAFPEFCAHASVHVEFFHCQQILQLQNTTLGLYEEFNN